MGLSFWSCCGRQYFDGVKSCLECGKPKKALGVLPDKPKRKAKAKAAPKPPKKAITKHPKIDYDKIKDPLIGDNVKYYVSTLKMK